MIATTMKTVTTIIKRVQCSSNTSSTGLLLCVMMFLLLSVTASSTAATMTHHQPTIERQRRKRRSAIASSPSHRVFSPKGSISILPRGGAAADSSAPSSSSSKAAASSSSAVTEGLKNSLASGLAAACSKALLAPFDTIKTVQQKYRGSGEALGFMDAVSIICKRKGGVWELYSGLGVAALGSMPSVGLYFGVYSYSKRILVPFFQSNYGSSRVDDKKPLFSDSALRTMGIAMSACIGNTVASFSRVPFEVVKQKLQSGLYASTLDAVSSMIREGGLRAFFPTGGISIQMVRDIPYAVFTLLSYEYIRENWVKKAEHPSAWRDLTAGAISGGIGSYLTNPLDVIKTRIQTDTALYKGSITQCARATFEEGGFMAFLRGSVPRLMHKIPANGCFFLFYELFRRLLKVEESKKSKEKSEK